METFLKITGKFLSLCDPAGDEKSTLRSLKRRKQPSLFGIFENCFIIWCILYENVWTKTSLQLWLCVKKKCQSVMFYPCHPCLFENEQQFEFSGASHTLAPTLLKCLKRLHFDHSKADFLDYIDQREAPHRSTPLYSVQEICHSWDRTNFSTKTLRGFLFAKENSLRLMCWRRPNRETFPLF